MKVYNEVILPSLGLITFKPVRFTTLVGLPSPGLITFKPVRFTTLVGLPSWVYFLIKPQRFTTLVGLPSWVYFFNKTTEVLDDSQVTFTGFNYFSSILNHARARQPCYSLKKRSSVASIGASMISIIYSINVKKTSYALINMSFTSLIYRKIFKPIFFMQDPEKVHDRMLVVGKFYGSNFITRNLVSMICNYKHEMLEQTVKEIHFRNPLGLSAGFDKDANLMKVLGKCGFAYAELGSMTYEAYEGNPKPRLVRIPEKESIIVYYGLKNIGAKKIRERIKKLKGKDYDLKLGVSIAKTNKNHSSTKEKVLDFVNGYKVMKDIGVYHTINISCPNTFDTCFFHEPELFEELLKELVKTVPKKRKPIFIKMNPDLNLKQIDKLIAIADKYGIIDGWIMSNLTKDRKRLGKSEKKYSKYNGGLSGKPVNKLSLEKVKYLYKKFKKENKNYILIGCGGIFTAEDAYDYIKAGASLLQLITGMIFNGPTAMKSINKGLVKLLKKDGYKNISEAIGVEAN